MHQTVPFLYRAHPLQILEGPAPPHDRRLCMCHYVLDGTGMQNCVVIGSGVSAPSIRDFTVPLGWLVFISYWVWPVVDLEGGRAGSAALPPLGRQTITLPLTVLLICDNGTVLWRNRRQFISSTRNQYLCRRTAAVVFRKIAECLRLGCGHYCSFTVFVDIRTAAWTAWVRMGY